MSGIDERYRVKMNILAAGLDEAFNGKAHGGDRRTGFVLLVFPFGGAEGNRCNYISNGASRKDMAAMFREMAARFEGQADVNGRA